MPVHAKAAIRSVILGVPFSEALPGLCDAVEPFCKDWGATLRVAHADDGPDGRFLAITGAGDWSDALAALRAESGRAAARRLAAVARRFDPALAVDTALLSGDAPRALVTHAAEAKADLLVIGAGRQRLGAGGYDCSTAVAVIAEAQLPVMVVGPGAATRRRPGPPTVVVADDLGPAGLAALAFAGGLCERPEGATVVHVHVARPEDLLAETGADYQQRLGSLRRRCEASLGARAMTFAAALERQGGRYLAEFAVGGLTDELEKTAAAFGADLMVFGRHRHFHREEQRAGVLPYRLMLEQPCPVIVVPA